MLDVGLMQAGASVKGEFEKRLRAVIDEVQASEVPVILFIDEAHTLIGAGGAAGTGDAANLLKPALARGELRTIAATTWSEYKQHIEKDPALTRRFQVVQGRGARRGGGGADAARRRRRAREAPRGADPRRGDRGGGRPVAPLHPGAAAARQGGQPARHRLRPRRGVAARDAGRGRGPPPRAGRCWRSSAGIIDREAAIGIDVAARRDEARRRRWPRTSRRSRPPRRAGSRSATLVGRRSSSCAPGCAARACRSTRRPRPRAASRRLPEPESPEADVAGRRGARAGRSRGRPRRAAAR